MDESPRRPPSYFFTLRLWLAEAGSGQPQWRGKLQHVPSGETRYFQDWPALVVCLGTLLPEPGRSPLSVDGEHDLTARRPDREQF